MLQPSVLSRLDPAWFLNYLGRLVSRDENLLTLLSINNNRPLSIHGVISPLACVSAVGCP